MTKAMAQKGLAQNMRRVLPRSWNAAAGLLRDRKQALAKHARSVRKEWKRSA